MDSAAIIAIDPGTRESGVCSLYPGEDTPHLPRIVANGEVLDYCRTFAGELGDGAPLHIGIEMIACYGMPVGADVFETVLWIGNFVTHLRDLTPQPEIRKVFRKDVKMHLCQSPRAKDANIRQALIDLYEPTGGGKLPQVGTKNAPGPLYGVSSHIWAALGVARVTRDLWPTLKPFSMISAPMEAQSQQSHHTPPKKK